MTHWHKSRAKMAMEIALRTDITQQMAEAEYGVSRASISDAKLIHKYGTAEDVQAASEGKIGIKTLARTLRASLTSDQRAERLGRTSKIRAPAALQQRELAVILFTKLQPAIVNLSAMPAASSVVDIVKANVMRESTVDSYLTTARTWLEEFDNAWKQYKQSKGSNTDSGRGGSSTGGQHLKQAS